MRKYRYYPNNFTAYRPETVLDKVNRTLYRIVVWFSLAIIFYGIGCLIARETGLMKEIPDEPETGIVLHSEQTAAILEQKPVYLIQAAES